ncbi:MAG: hypothetical protein E7354_01565 [Clostridiales bacterium]|nr:hypothetical protein [Clostridiales bacterium]
MKNKLAIKQIFMIILITLVIVLSIIAIWINIYLKDVKCTDISLGTNTNNCCYIFDDENNMKKISRENNKPIKISQLNDYTIKAFLSIEDKKFYEHNGINLIRIVKSTLDNILSGKIIAGGSTITQQLVKNKFLNNDKTIKRKVQEIYLAKKIESQYTKDEILESYLNTIYYGHGAYGIENASLRYFSKSASELSLSESCVLASVINSPTTYSPINNIEKCTERRNLVLKEMNKDGYITDEEYKVTTQSDILLHEKELTTEIDLYDQFAINEASKKLGISVDEIYRNKYKIFTGKNSDTQQTLDEIINNEKYYHKNSYENKADSLSMIIDNETNMVVAVSGKSDYNLVDLERQPGSLIKPLLVYAPAIEEGIVNPMTQIYDGEINYKGYSPNNASGVSNDYISIKDAISKSLNIPAVKVCDMVGLDKCKLYAKKCGFNLAKEDSGYALALGGTTKGFTIQTILDAYSTLVFEGFYSKSNFVKLIKNNKNMTIYNNKVSERNVYSIDTAYIMTDMLKYSTKNGTSKKLANLQYDIAGKTGTVGIPNTNFNTDAYSLAYTTKHRMAVWFGNYSMDKEHHLEGSNNGGTYATEVLKSLCDKLYKNTPPKNFSKPESIIECDIDSIKLTEEHKVYLADEKLPERYKIKEIFSKSHIPEKASHKYNLSPNLSIKKCDKNITICFTANKYSEYKLYRKYNNVDTLLDTFKNKNEEIKYIDNNLLDGKKYTYYLVCYNSISDESFITESKSVYYSNDAHNKYLNELEIVDNYSWLFA